MIEVRVGRLPGTLTPVALEDGATVGQAISTSGVSRQTSDEVRRNGATANDGDTVGNGDTILLVRKIKGNR